MYIFQSLYCSPSKKLLHTVGPEATILTYLLSAHVKGKGKVFPYSLPSVGPGADPGVQAVSPQVT